MGALSGKPRSYIRAASIAPECSAHVSHGFASSVSWFRYCRRFAIDRVRPASVLGHVKAPPFHLHLRLPRTAKSLARFTVTASLGPQRSRVPCSRRPDCRNCSSARQGKGQVHMLVSHLRDMTACFSMLLVEQRHPRCDSKRTCPTFGRNTRIRSSRRQRIAEAS